MPAVDDEEIEGELVATLRKPGQDLARIAGEEMHPAGELALQGVDAFHRVLMAHDVDAVILQLRVRREREQAAVAGVDPDLQNPVLEARGAPDIATGRRERWVRRTLREAFVAVGEEDVALEPLAGRADERVEPAKTLPKRFREDLLEGVAADRIVGDLRGRDRLSRDEFSAVHVRDPPIGFQEAHLSHRGRHAHPGSTRRPPIRLEAIDAPD